MTASFLLPEPDSIAQQHSDKLVSVIKKHIIDSGGKIDFAHYMNLCLYAPGLGYYSAGSHKLGQHGDFTTAPEISSLFSQTLAKHIQDVFKQLNTANILEFGAGTGKMAVDILGQLERDDALPETYFIIEASADLRQRQEKSIYQSIPHLAERIMWLDQMPDSFIGVILANEVCDAMPVHCLHVKNNQVFQRYVGINNNEFVWCDDDIDNDDLTARANNIQAVNAGISYITEVNLTAEAWVVSLAERLIQGAIFIIDYGYPQTDYYHPQRNTGTMMCYYQHQGHDNPFILQGLQDITAHVDFTALAEAAFDNGLDVAGFQAQADFLIAGDIALLIAENSSEAGIESIKLANQLKQLTLPSAMGETFKVLTLTKSLADVLPRLQLADRRYSL
ncbi:MAG: SAM-dependent methyltransferase [Gammaproteobacteria bacterium]|nr:SAM-dependent methyltransferase [Gammaproteobacteria bacterium]